MLIGIAIVSAIPAYWLGGRAYVGALCAISILGYIIAINNINAVGYGFPLMAFPLWWTPYLAIRNRLLILDRFWVYGY